MVAVASGCGTSELIRPLPVEIEGLSARASVLVLKVFPADAFQSCQGIELSTAVGLSTPHEVRWQRASMADRVLEIPAINTERLTIVAYSLDANGAPMQFSCSELDFAGIGELPEGVLIITLTQRMT